MLGACFTGSVHGMLTKSCCKLAYCGNKHGQDDPATVTAEEGRGKGKPFLGLEAMRKERGGGLGRSSGKSQRLMTWLLRVRNLANSAMHHCNFKQKCQLKKVCKHVINATCVHILVQGASGCDCCMLQISDQPPVSLQLQLDALCAHETQSQSTGRICFLAAT